MSTLHWSRPLMVEYCSSIKTGIGHGGADGVLNDSSTWRIAGAWWRVPRFYSSRSRRTAKWSNFTSVSSLSPRWSSAKAANVKNHVYFIAAFIRRKVRSNFIYYRILILMLVYRIEIDKLKDFAIEKNYEGPRTWCKSLERPEVSQSSISIYLFSPQYVSTLLSKS